MNNKNEIQKELLEKGIILPSTKGQPFDIQEAYFQNFNQQFWDRISSEEFINTLPKEMPYAVINNYFEKLSFYELSEVSLALPKTTPYQIPNNYFENFSIDLEEQKKVEETVKADLSIGYKKAKQFKLKKQLFAGAAALLVLVVSIYFINMISLKNGLLQNEQNVSSISSEAAKEYLITNMSEFETENLAIANEHLLNTVSVDNFNAAEVNSYLEAYESSELF